MLVLTRKSGEAILVGDSIRLRIVSVRGHKVKVAVEAPDTVSIRREEIACCAPPRMEMRMAFADDHLDHQHRPAIRRRVG